MAAFQHCMAFSFQHAEEEVGASCFPCHALAAEAVAASSCLEESWVAFALGVVGGEAYQAYQAYQAYHQHQKVEAVEEHFLAAVPSLAPGHLQTACAAFAPRSCLLHFSVPAVSPQVFHASLLSSLS